MKRLIIKAAHEILDMNLAFSILSYSCAAFFLVMTILVIPAAFDFGSDAPCSPRHSKERTR